jgi:benzylsuccinate CoA-transferase BbsF subunit
MSKQPFEGINVLDFTWAGVGPFTVNYLAYFGATVVKVENNRRPDVTRTNPPYKDGIPGVDRSIYFAWSNPTKKYDITIDLNNARGVGLAKRLVGWADIVVESFLPGTLEKWGLGYEDLKKIKPDIIMLRTCMHGQTGSLAKHPGLGFVLTSLAGYNLITGWPDRGSSELYGAYSDYIAPLFGGLSVIAALDYRQRTGKGQCLDLAQHEVAIQFMSPLILDSAVNHREPVRNGNCCSYAAPHGAYRCQGNDRWCAISVFTDEEWKSFCAVIGNPGWTAEPKFATMLGRVKHSSELDKLVEEWTVNHTAEEVMTRMQDAGVPAGVVANAKDMAEDVQLKHYNYYHELDHPYLGKGALYQTPAFRLTDATARVSLPPSLGEHNEYVCTKILGISDDEFAGLVQDGVFE